MQPRGPSPFVQCMQHWDRTSRPRPTVRAKAVAMARHHPEELGLVLRFVGVMIFFGLMAGLGMWVAGA